jgi:cell division protein FtsB
VATGTGIGGLRRRRAPSGLARTLLGVSALVALVYFAYETGRAQNRTTVQRLQTDLEAATTAVQQARTDRAVALERASATEQRARAEVDEMRAHLPQGALLDLMRAAEARMELGVAPARIVEVVRRVPVAPPCATPIERLPLTVRVPTSVEPPQTLAFADGRLLVAASGAAVPPEQGHASTDFDPARPVEVRFLQLGGASDMVRGELPLTHSVVVAEEEHRFGISRGGAPGTLEVAVQRCPFP